MTAIAEAALPTEIEAFRGLSFSLDCLQPDSAETAPVTSEEIEEYLALESGGASSLADYEFLRTAKINDGRAWLWRHPETGELLFLFDKGEQGEIGLVANWAGLTPEQFLVAHFFGRHHFQG